MYVAQKVLKFGMMAVLTVAVGVPLLWLGMMAVVEASIIAAQIFGWPEPFANTPRSVIGEIMLVILVAMMAREQTFPSIFRRLSLLLPRQWIQWKFGVAVQLDNADMGRLERLAREEGKRVELYASDLLSEVLPAADVRAAAAETEWQPIQLHGRKPD